MVVIIDEQCPQCGGSGCKHQWSRRYVKVLGPITTTTRHLDDALEYDSIGDAVDAIRQSGTLCQHLRIFDTKGVNK